MILLKNPLILYQDQLTRNHPRESEDKEIEKEVILDKIIQQEKYFSR